MRLKCHLLASNPKFLDNWEEEYLCGGGGTWLAFYGTYLCLKYGRFKPHFTKTFRKCYYIEVSHFTLIQYTEAFLKPSHVFLISLFLSIPISICGQTSWIVQCFCCIFVTPIAQLRSLLTVVPRVQSFVVLLRFLLHFPKRKHSLPAAVLSRSHRHSHFVPSTTLLYAPFFSNSFWKMLWCQPSY